MSLFGIGFRIVNEERYIERKKIDTPIIDETFININSFGDIRL
jgi:hypothetical protein